MVRTATETRGDNNGVTVEMKDNRDVRQGQQRRQRRTGMVAEMRDNQDVYGGGGDVGRQHMICGTLEMTKWVGRTATDWENIDREKLPTYGCIVAPG